MGASQAKLHKAVELELLSRTHFSAPELRRWYSNFIAEFPQGTISRDRFVTENLKFTNFGDKEFWAHFFDLFDEDHNNEISFAEWITALSLILRGTEDEKIEYLFKLYDLDNDGGLTRGELEQIITFLTKVKPVQQRPRQLVNAAFLTMDANHDDLISLEEFSKGLRKYPKLLEALDILSAIFGPSWHGAACITPDLPRASANQDAGATESSALISQSKIPG